MTAIGSVLRKSLRVKPYYLCHGRLGPAAQLVAHEQCRYDTGERRRSSNERRIKPSNPIETAIAALRAYRDKIDQAIQVLESLGGGVSLPMGIGA